MAFLPLNARRPRHAFQIVATLGPASVDRAAALAQAGVTSFRLNASHLTPLELRQTVDRVRDELPDAPWVIDLQGAKMRLGVFVAREVQAGETVRFSCAPAGPDEIPLPHPELFQAIRRGETLSLDDDRLRFRITDSSPLAFCALALRTGPLRPRKGVNVVEHPVELADLSGSDLACLAELREVPGIAWAFSFMKDGTEARWIRHHLANALVVGKIERAEAIAHLSAIDEEVDSAWICRGDLGAQIGSARLAAFVSRLDPSQLRRPWLMAGQVLEHLTQNPEPTRSEVCHLHDLVARGYAGIVLSDETAVGRDPVRAAQIAVDLIREFNE